jgi:hypothetical protein
LRAIAERLGALQKELCSKESVLLAKLLGTRDELLCFDARL